VLLVGLGLSAYNGYCEDSVSVEYDAEHCHFHDGYGLGVWVVATSLLGGIAFVASRLVPDRGSASLGRRLVRGLLFCVPVVGALALGFAALFVRASSS
jgi:hypothetical protein